MDTPTKILLVAAGLTGVVVVAKAFAKPQAPPYFPSCPAADPYAVVDRYGNTQTCNPTLQLAKQSAEDYAAALKAVQYVYFNGAIVYTSGSGG